MWRKKLLCFAANRKSKLLVKRNYGLLYQKIIEIYILEIWSFSSVLPLVVTGVEDVGISCSLLHRVFCRLETICTRLFLQYIQYYDWRSSCQYVWNSNVELFLERQTIEKSLRLIEEASCLKFYKRSGSEKNWIRFYKGSG